MAASEITGWLLDLYAGPTGEVVLWLLGEDGGRHRLTQPFPVTFYAAGEAARLRQLWRHLKAQPVPVRLERAERRDLFQPQPLEVLAVQVASPAAQPGLFQRAAELFPDLTFYDADLPLNLRHAACHNTFPLARCRVMADEQGRLQALETLDSPWDLDPCPPPLRTLTFQPDRDPFHAEPTHLMVRAARACYSLSLASPRPLLINLRAILEREDPDLLLTLWGDGWLLPRLLKLSQTWRIPLPLNREAGLEVARKAEHTYFSYGQVIYRGPQVHLFGRWHIDGCNAMLFHDYAIEGVLELARVTSLPVQTVARVSPGSGISAMQMLTALRLGVLVPWHKQRPEDLKSALDLLHADQGGLIYQPLTGLHPDVAEIDFISMYPGIMARFNISPETVGSERPTAELVPELGMVIDQEHPGLVPQTLSPLLEKRLALKARLAELPGWDPRRLRYKACTSAHKWLLVTCFGYLGYKNARFGRIEAHEAVTAYGREALMRAKEAAEDQGFTVLHMYVDGLWVQKAGARRPGDFQPLLDEIVARTSLPIALEGVYRWVAFIPSRLDERIPVPNRYFGVFQDGSLKCRGIEARRGDTPSWIAGVQMALLEHLAHAPDAAALPEHTPGAMRILRRALAELHAGQVPLEKLLISQKLSRDLEAYRSPSPGARAAAQLTEAGKTVKRGQRVRFLFTRGRPGVHAWDMASAFDRRAIDLARYQELLLRAAAAIFQPLGITEPALRLLILEDAAVRPLPLYREGRLSGSAKHLTGLKPVAPAGFVQEMKLAVDLLQPID